MQQITMKRESQCKLGKSWTTTETEEKIIDQQYYDNIVNAKKRRFKRSAGVKFTRKIIPLMVLELLKS